jgi:hypothetical protein
MKAEEILDELCKKNMLKDIQNIMPLKTVTIQAMKEYAEWCCKGQRTQDALLLNGGLSLQENYEQILETPIFKE